MKSECTLKKKRCLQKLVPPPSKACHFSSILTRRMGFYLVFFYSIFLQTNWGIYIIILHYFSEFSVHVTNSR